jgi:CheY-like chemotaxis protein
MPVTVVTWVPDIFFLAKIQETARAVGVRVVSPVVSPVGSPVGSPVASNDARLTLEGIAEARPQAIILDLNSCGAPALEWIRSLKSDPATRLIPIVGFASHVQEQLISAAREAGCDKVMARSAFTQQLPALLGGLANPEST